MKYCTYCGTQIEDNALFCPNCGAKQSVSNTNSGSGERSFFEEHAFGNTYNTQGSFFANDPLVTERSKGIAVLSFILPIVGLILWLVWRYTKPGKATSAAKGGLASLCFGYSIIGLVAWLVLKDSNPELAKPCGIAAIAGAIFGFIISIAVGVLTSMGMLDGAEMYISLVGAMLSL